MNNKQLSVVKKVVGPCIVFAGAGTGKTFTIVKKIKYLVDNSICKSNEIVCLTFSNDAANSLQNRVRREFEEFDNGEPIIRTFHGFSADILKSYGDKIGINKNFKILNPDEAKIILHQRIDVPVVFCGKYINSIGTAKDLGIDIISLKNYLHKKILDKDVINLNRIIEDLQFEFRTLYLRKDNEKKRKLLNDIKRFRSLLELKNFINAWENYEALKIKNSYQDYSDLNQNALRLLRKFPELSEHYKYVIVDEFQDTNKVQLDLLFNLVRNANITVVGDINQSIYRFRGAYKENYSEFKKFFNVKNKDIFTLDSSFRSSNKILKVAYELITNNKTEDCFLTKNFKDREGDFIEVYELNNSREEARKVLELIEKETSLGKRLKDICVMFRTHQQGRIIKRLLDIKEIPYYSVTKNSLLKQKSIKMVIDYLQIVNKIVNKKKGGEQAWWDIIYQSNFIEDDLIKIGRFIKKNNLNENLGVFLLDNLIKLDLSDNGKLIVKLLSEKIKLIILSIKKELPELIIDIYKVGGFFNDNKTREEKEVMLNLNKFLEVGRNYVRLYFSNLNGFLRYLEIADSLGIEISAAELENEGVRLMTSHSTKGLEYDVVIMTNMVQKRFPMECRSNGSIIPMELYPEFVNLTIPEKDIDYYIYCSQRENQLFEERRLCYVSFTRARKNLFITYSKKYGSKNYFPSQFLNEINYKKNENVKFFIDDDEKYVEPKVEFKSALDFDVILKRENFEDLLINIVKSFDKDKKQNKVFFNRMIFSPSSLLKFMECQKKYEYRYVYNMPEKNIVSWDSIQLGSFVHLILERGVSWKFKKVSEFINLASEIHLKEEWNSIKLEDACSLIRVFFERNKNKFNEMSKTEQVLNCEFSGIKFKGFADRIDFNSEGIEIIDYKTGKRNVPPLAREWQLGYYALAASEFGKVRKITLDMLQHEKPIEFELNENGNAIPTNSNKMRKFNIYDVKEELVRTASRILDAYNSGFKPCSVDKNCEFCNEYVYTNVPCENLGF